MKINFYCNIPTIKIDLPYSFNSDLPNTVTIQTNDIPNFKKNLLVEHVVNHEYSNNDDDPYIEIIDKNIHIKERIIMVDHADNFSWIKIWFKYKKI